VERLAEGDYARIKSLLVDLHLGEQVHYSDHPQLTRGEIERHLEVVPAKFQGENIIYAVRDEVGDVIGFCWIVLYDPGTGLMTRQAFERQASALLASATSAETHIILYLDSDRLHVINETFGMHVGDDVIVSVAECMAKSLPAGALSARISGDRLAALIPNSSMDAAAVVAEKIRVAAAAIVPRAAQGSFEVSACLGVAPIGRAENTLAHALATAEIACKAAKDRGRNRVEMFQDSDQSIIRRHTDILVIGKLREALGNDSFRLDAQPILPLRANYGRPRFELLIRMLGDRGEVIPPGKFLSAAERYQLMPTIDRWVVRRACELLGEHSASVGTLEQELALMLSDDPIGHEKAEAGAALLSCEMGFKQVMSVVL